MNMKTSLKMLLLAAVAALALSCGGRRTRQQQQAVAEAAAGMKVFLPPIAPSGLAPAEQRDYLRCPLLGPLRLLGHALRPQGRHALDA